MADYSPSYPLPVSLEADSGLTRNGIDDHLIEGLRAGAEGAYEELIHRYQHPVHNLIYRLLDDPEEAPDVLQEVFLKIFRKIDSFRGQASLKTWIYRIAVNEAYNHRRFFSRHRKQEVGLECSDDQGTSLHDVIPDQCRSPFELALDSETHRVVEEALQEINPGFRSAVILRDLEELSYEEIAEVLQISLGTVKSRILRGREALRKILTERKTALSMDSFVESVAVGSSPVGGKLRKG